MQEEGDLFESCDALFGLPRKKSSGKSVREPLHGNLMFGDQSSVDDFVANSSNRGTSVSDQYWCTQTRIYYLGIHIHNSAGVQSIPCWSSS